MKLSQNLTILFHAVFTGLFYVTEVLLEATQSWVVASYGLLYICMLYFYNFISVSWIRIFNGSLNFTCFLSITFNLSIRKYAFMFCKKVVVIFYSCKIKHNLQKLFIKKKLYHDYLVYKIILIMIWPYFCRYVYNDICIFNHRLYLFYISFSLSA